MSSSAHITHDEGTPGIPDDAWRQFCARQAITLAGQSRSGWKYLEGGGDVNVTHFGPYHTYFSTIHMGELMPEVARLAIACWAEFGGRLTVSPEIAQIIPAGDRPDDLRYLAPGEVVPGTQERNAMLAALREFRDQHGHARVPATYVTAGGLELGIWLANKEHTVRSGGQLHPATTQALAACGVPWAPARTAGQ